MSLLEVAFTNPFRDPASVPEVYRNHYALQKLFQVNGAYVRPAEDPVTMWIIDLLVREYGVPLDAMGLEVFADFSEGTFQGGRRYQGRADVIIHDDRFVNSVGGLDVAFIMVEAMEPGKRYEGTEPEGWIEHLNRLNSYMSASPSARYAILTNGIHCDIYRRDLEYPRTLEKIGDLPKYESSREAAKHSPYTVILNPSVPDGVETGLKPLTRDKFREVLGDTRSGCHSILRDNEGLNPQEAVEAMVKFLFAKWYDELATVTLAKQTGNSCAYVFSVNPKTDPERLAIQVSETFRKAKAWEKETLKKKFGDNLRVRLAFDDSEELKYKTHTTYLIVQRLQPWSLRNSSSDIKGGVFEDFLSRTFRDELGQYFTPTPVINLMVGMLQPTINDFVGDPACGSGRMLTHILDYVRKKEFEKVVQASEESRYAINPDEPTEEFLRFRDNQVFGAEISRNVMHIARVNTLMNGAQYVDLKVMDSLEKLSSITGGVMQGLPNNPGFYPSGLSMILTNPPFGSKLTNSNVLNDFASRDGVSKVYVDGSGESGLPHNEDEKTGTRKKVKSVNGKKKYRVLSSLPQEVVFINRCLEFLAPGGKLAIVLPDGVLANSSMQFVREWVLRQAKLKAIVSLPQATFAPFGAGVKTSVVLFEKYENPIPVILASTFVDDIPELEQKILFSIDEEVVNSTNPDGFSDLEQEISLSESHKEEYDVYMARIEDIGYDSAGRLTVPLSETQEPPEVKEVIVDFLDRLGW